MGSLDGRERFAVACRTSTDTHMFPGSVKILRAPWSPVNGLADFLVERRHVAGAERECCELEPLIGGVRGNGTLSLIAR